MQSAWLNCSGIGDDLPRLSRWGMHATVVGLATAAIISGHLTGLASRAGAIDPAPPALSPARQTSARGGTGFLVRAAQPRTAAGATPTAEPGTRASTAGAPARGTETYTVQPGDTVFALAQRFGVTPDTILSANSALSGNPDLLQLGQQLTILPISGVLYEVKQGETLAAIANKFEIDASAIVAYEENNLAEPYTLQAGQKLMLPGARLLDAPLSRYASVGTSGRSAAATGAFMWPTTGSITQYAWWAHMAIDIGTASGTPIYAADGGTVEAAGWTNVGYGLHVVVDHGNGYRTLYGHMSAILVQARQVVAKGALIGRVGSTGISTGPHLHFEIYRSGVPQNPLNYLP